MIGFKHVIPGLLLGFLSLATSSFASELVPDEPVTIKTANSASSGCSHERPRAFISDDKRSLKLIYDEDFMVELDYDLPLSFRREQCSMQLVFNVPDGWQYRLGSFRYPVHMDLEEGVRATVRVNFELGALASSPTLSLNKDGPWSGADIYSGQFGSTSPNVPEIWSSCDKEGALFINTGIAVSPINSKKFPNAKGVFRIDSTNKFSEFELIWRRCTP